MIDSLQTQSTPTFEQIRQSDASFRPFEKNSWTFYKCQ